MGLAVRPAQPPRRKLRPSVKHLLDISSKYVSFVLILDEIYITIRGVARKRADLQWLHTGRIVRLSEARVIVPSIGAAL
jgi:hypothetical protein